MQEKICNSQLWLKIFAVMLISIVATIMISCSSDNKTSNIDENIGLTESTIDIREIYLGEADNYNEVMEQGGRIVNLDDPETFFVYWLPDGFSALPEKRIMVMLHGIDGNAYERIVVMDTVAAIEKFGIVAIQWGWPGDSLGQFIYLEPSQVHEIVAAALDYLESKYGIDKYISCLDGFNKASSFLPESAFLDKMTDTRFFTLFIGISGGCTTNRLLISHMQDGLYGPEPLSGCHFYFWCGNGNSSNLSCTAMDVCADTILALGGIIEKFYVCSDPNDNWDGGYYQNAIYPLEAVAIWKNISSRSESL